MATAFRSCQHIDGQNLVARVLTGKKAKSSPLSFKSVVFEDYSTIKSTYHGRIFLGRSTAECVVLGCNYCAYLQVMYTGTNTLYWKAKNSEDAIQFLYVQCVTFLCLFTARVRTQKVNKCCHLITRCSSEVYSDNQLRTVRASFQVPQIFAIHYSQVDKTVVVQKRHDSENVNFDLNIRRAWGEAWHPH